MDGFHNLVKKRIYKLKDRAEEITQPRQIPKEWVRNRRYSVKF